MKYCIVGMPRSRSSVLLETISLHYNIPILGEDIGNLSQRYGNEYITTLKNLLDNSLKKENGIIRLHPLQMVSIKPFTILNFDWFNFEQYDKIYFTFRESTVDNIASNFIATKLNKFTYKSQSDIVKDFDPVYFSKDDYYHIRDYIQSLNVIDSLKQYFNEQTIKSQDLYYKDIPKYITKYPAFTTHVETHYDYRKMISNYDDIIEIYKQLTK
jgi:hypothetical protein